MSVSLYSIGHSNRSFQEFVALLQAHGIELLADIRTAPSSRKWPYFNRSSFEAELPRLGIAYRHLPGLGGLRHGKSLDPTNAGLRSPGFRSYADYMQTPEFEAALDELIELGRQRPTAYMCAEALWWRCHRSLVSDALVARGVRVVHIMGAHKTEEHRLRPFVVVRDGRPTYPAPDPRH